jgi:hypothetical protein
MSAQGEARRAARRFLLATALLAFLAISAGPSTAQVAVGISVAIAPPLLPTYVQPPIPSEGYIWTPGYWAWDVADGYYWVPGAWVLPPSVGVLWTPAYWGWSNGAYLFHEGYWGPHVGFYGGVNYGYGYGGNGFDGGRWDNGRFHYNREVNNFGATRITNVYAGRPEEHGGTRVSYAGGAGGVRREPTAEERTAEQERHQPGDARPQAHADVRADAHVAPASAAHAAAARAQPQHAVSAAQHPTEQRAMGRPQPQHAAPQRAQPRHTQVERTQPQHDQGQGAQPQHAQAAQHAPAPRPTEGGGDHKEGR